MKATLIFNLPEEHTEFMFAIQGWDWKCVVDDIDEMLRTALKHGHKYKTADEALEAVRRLLWHERESRGLVID